MKYNRNISSPKQPPPPPPQETFQTLPVPPQQNKNGKRTRTKKKSHWRRSVACFQSFYHNKNKNNYKDILLFLLVRYVLFTCILLEPYLIQLFKICILFTIPPPPTPFPHPRNTTTLRFFATPRVGKRGGASVESENGVGDFSPSPTPPRRALCLS